MSENKKMGSLTPIPVSDFSALTKNMNKVSTAVIRMEGKIDTVKDDLLPPVAVDAKEARDGVMRLNGRVTALEDADPSHECFEQGRQLRQDTDLAEVKERSKGASKLLWWVLGVSVLVGSAAVGFAISTSVDASTVRTQVEDLDGVDDQVTRHDVQIESLQKAQAEDRKVFLSEVRALPMKVQQVAERRDPTIADIEDVADDLPLTGRERDMMVRILRQAKKRSASNP